MKKYWRGISLMLALVVGLLFVCSAPVDTYAAENENHLSPISQEEFWSIVSEAFPIEYQNAAACPATFASEDLLENDTVVSSQTKAISDTENVVYFEFSSGRAGFLYSVDFINDSTVTGSGYKTVTEHIYLSVTGYNGMLYITNFKYTIYNSAYDKINNAGENSSGISTAMIQVHSWNESASGPALVTYAVPFEYVASPGTNRFFYLYVYVGNDARTYELYAPTT